MAVIKAEQKSESRDQTTGDLEWLLREAMPPIGGQTGKSDDLWPAMERRLRAERAPAPMKGRVPWFDWVLAGALVVSLALFPAWIPVLLYYL